MITDTKFKSTIDELLKEFGKFPYTRRASLLRDILEKFKETYKHDQSYPLQNDLNVALGLAGLYTRYEHFPHNKPIGRKAAAENGFKIQETCLICQYNWSPTAYHKVRCRYHNRDVSVVGWCDHFKSIAEDKRE